MGALAETAAHAGGRVSADPWAMIEARVLAHVVSDHIKRYDALTGGDIRRDSEVRPIVVAELAACMFGATDLAAETLADALARRAADKLKGG